MNACTHIQNQTRERNANVAVLSYRFNRDEGTDRQRAGGLKILSVSHLLEHYDTLSLRSFFSLPVDKHYPSTQIDYWREIRLINQSILTTNQ